MGTSTSSGSYNQLPSLALGGEISVREQPGDPLSVPLSIDVNSLEFNCAYNCDAMISWLTIGLQTDVGFPALTYTTTVGISTLPGIVIQEDFAADRTSQTLLDQSTNSSYHFSGSASAGASVLNGTVSIGFLLPLTKSAGGENVTYSGDGIDNSTQTGTGGLSLAPGVENSGLTITDTAAPEPAYTIPIVLAFAAGGACLWWGRRKRA
jgi:hypothetical protein